MQSHYDAAFTREMGCTPKEWHGWLAQAIGTHAWQLFESQANVNFPSGQLQISWVEADARVIASVRIPRLIVSFNFEGLSEAQRYVFMRRFDLFMQRGGG